MHSLLSRNVHWIRWLLLALIVLGGALSGHQVASSQPMRGDRDFVPNGSFEQLTEVHERKPNNIGEMIWPIWKWHLVYQSRWWRQFHSYFQSQSGKPPAIIGYYEDRTPYLYLVSGRLPLGDFYDPVSCSTADLFTTEQESCERGLDKPLFGIPENWFGYESVRQRPDAVNRRYAGLYYRLNGVRKTADGLNEPIPFDKVQNAATDLWREYLEVELVCPLEQGKQYTLTFYASLAEVSSKALRLEARISPKPYLTVPSDKCTGIPDDDGPDAKVGIPYSTSATETKNQSDFIENKDGWTPVTYTFTAKGEERFLTIGNFEAIPKVIDSRRPYAIDCVPAYSNSNATEIAYYYIDDVRLTQSIDCFCKNNDQAFKAKLVKIDPQDPSQCCYSIQVSNGGIGSAQADCLYGACTIYGVDFLKPGSTGAGNDVMFSWKSRDTGNVSPMKEPIIADNQWHELGILCVPAFSNTEVRDVIVAIKGLNDTTLCKQQITYTGCTGTCGCDDFNQSVVVKMPNPGNKCCFEVSIDASKLKAGCEIASVDVYSDASLTEMITPSYTPTNPVGTTFAGTLYTFCLDRSNGNANGLKEIVFRDVNGKIICRKSVELYCECDCGTRPPRLRIDFTPSTLKDGKCCYDLTIDAITACDFTLKDLAINTDELLDITPNRDWTLARIGTSHVLTPSKGSVRGLVHNALGSICIAPCMAFDPHALNINAHVSTNGQDSAVECEVPVEISHGDDLKQCRGSKSCDDVVLSLVTPNSSSTPALDDCCRKVSVQIRGCTILNKCLIIDITGPNGTPLKTTNLGGGVFESAAQCRNYRAGDTFTVVVRDLHGNLICTKTISVPSCTRLETNQ